MNIQNLDLRRPGGLRETTAADVDLHAIISTFRRRLRLFVVVAMAVVVGAVVFSYELTPRYTATSYVMIDTRKRAVTNVSAVLSGLPINSSSVDTEVEILKSRSLAARVVAGLKLDQDPEFDRR